MSHLYTELEKKLTSRTFYQSLTLSEGKNTWVVKTKLFARCAYCIAQLCTKLLHLFIGTIIIVQS